MGPSPKSRRGRQGLPCPHLLRRDRVRVARRRHAACMELGGAPGRVGRFRAELPSSILLAGLRRLP